MRHALQSGGAIVVILMFTLAGTAHAQEKRTQETVQRWPIWGFGYIEVIVPPDWSGELNDRPSELDQPPFVVLKSERDRLYVTIAPVIPPEKGPLPREQFIDFVKEHVRALPERNPDNTYGTIVEVPGVGAPASAVRISLGTPDAMGFKHLTYAYAYSDEQVIKMQVRTDQLVSRERDRALTMLKTAGMKVPSTQPSDLRVRGPGKDWEVVMTTLGFEKVSQESGDVSVLLRAQQARLGMELTIFLEPAEKPGDATVARDFYVAKFKEAMKQRQAPMEGPDLGGNGDVALSQHLFPQLRQKHVTAYLVQDGVWVTVHASKRTFKPEDSKLFSQMLGSIRFESTKPLAASGPATQPK